MTKTNPAHENARNRQIRPACWGGPLPEPSVRTAEDLRDVLARPDCTIAGPVYFMYRNVAQSAEDRSWLESRQLRFDISRQKGTTTPMIHQVPATRRSMRC